MAIALWLKAKALNSREQPVTIVPEADSLGVFWPRLTCEIAEANVRQFQWFSLRFSSTFNPFRSIVCHFQSVSASFNQFQSILISFNQFDSVKNAGVY